MREGVITLRTVFGKFFCTAVTLGSGIPLGPEGPSLHVGSGIASVLARRFGLRTESVKSLIPVGAAAAIAAAFNTPLAAVVYALEGIAGRTSLHRALASGEGAKSLKELAAGTPLPHVHADHPLDLVLERMGVAKVEDVLPVVSGARIRLLLGVIALPDIVNSFGVNLTDADNPLNLKGKKPFEQS